MKTSEEYKNHIGKVFRVHLADSDTTLEITLDAVEEGDAFEGDDIPEEVNKNPFSLLFSGPLDQRVPNDTHKVSVEGGGGPFDLYLDPCCNLNQEDEKLTYEAQFA